MKIRRISDQGVRRLATAMVGIDIAILLACLPFVAIVAAETPGRSLALELVSRLFFVPFLAMGLLIARSQPRNAVGWVLMGGTSVMIVNELALAYATYAIDRSTPGGVVAAWITSWIWFGAFGAVGALFFLFPTGKAPSSRWRIVMWVGAVGLIVCIIGNALWQRPIDGFGNLANPYGIGGRAGDVIFVISRIGATVFFWSIALSGVSLFLRMRRSVGEERQQLKWFFFAGVLVTSSIFGMAATYREGEPRTALVVFFMGAMIASTLFLAVAIGVAILKYRLYDIDVVINRTLVYAVLTGILAAAYAGLVFGFQTILAPFTSESDLAVAASTLAVAALFRPVRARVQDFIDRRFYRRKFDAQRTLESFGSTIRDEVELPEISSRLVQTIADTMQPAHLSLWLREAR